MLPTTLPLWSTIVAAFGAIALVEAFRFIGFHQLRRQDSRLFRTGVLSGLIGLYAIAAAVTYAQPSPTDARPWVEMRNQLAALFPWAYIATAAAFLGKRRRAPEFAMLATGVAIAVAGRLWPAGVLTGEFRVREFAAVQQTFYDFDPGPLAHLTFFLAAVAVMYVLVMFLRDWRPRRASRLVAASLLAFGLCGMLDVATVYGWTSLPYVLEFGSVFVSLATNWSLLNGYFDTLAEKEHLERARSRLLTNISHELRTPLGVAVGYIELLERRPEQMTPKQQESLRRARNALLEETELIDELIHLSRWAATEPEPERQPVAIADIVSRIFKQLAVLAQRKSVGLHADVAPNCSATVDPTWFQLAVKNLVHNAIKFSPVGGQVHVYAQASADELVVRVEDQGVGIAAGEQQVIFERFVQGSNARNDVDTGLGVGLALVRDVVQAHGGYVRVFSRVGKGSIFELRLPTTADAPPLRQL